jgi:hypothetical protein
MFELRKKKGKKHCESCQEPPARALFSGCRDYGPTKKKLKVFSVSFAQVI